jgi:predicted Zn-dependent protease with MMP-like domain
MERPHRKGFHVSEERFDELVADALDMIPAELDACMDNVAVCVDDWPSAEQIGAEGGTLLGLYEGIELTDRSPLSYGGVLPDRITIFRGPLCEMSTNEDELRHNIAVTVIHEVAHHFGIDDDRLEDLGWG